MAQAQVYTDLLIPWSPSNKIFDLICFTDDNKLDLIDRDIEVLTLNPTRMKYQKNGVFKVIENKPCILEQKTEMTVSRLEFLEAIYKVDCDITISPIRKSDFRMLKSTKSFTAIKRLTDGKVYILPTKMCKFKMVLKSIKNEPKKMSPKLPPIDIPRGLQ